MSRVSRKSGPQKTYYLFSSSLINTAEGDYQIVAYSDSPKADAEFTLVSFKVKSDSGQGAGLYKAVNLLLKENEGKILRIAFVFDNIVVVNSLSRWIEGWIENGFVSKKGEPIKDSATMKKILEREEAFDSVEYIYVNTSTTSSTRRTSRNQTKPYSFDVESVYQDIEDYATDLVSEKGLPEPKRSSRRRT